MVKFSKKSAVRDFESNIFKNKGGSYVAVIVTQIFRILIFKCPTIFKMFINMYSDSKTTTYVRVWYIYCVLQNTTQRLLLHTRHMYSRMSESCDKHGTWLCFMLRTYLCHSTLILCFILRTYKLHNLLRNTVLKYA